MASKRSAKTTKTSAKKAAKKTVKKAVKKAPKKAVKKRKKRKKSKDKEKHYVDSKVFFEQICEYYRTDIIPDELSTSLIKIANGLGYAPNFINYSYKDEMIGDAVLKMFSALKNKKFNIESGNNPFSYFTTVAFHAFINRIKKEKKHKDTVTKYQETVYFDKMADASGSVYVNPETGCEEDEN